MALETAVTIQQLNPSYPSASDRIHQGDDHIRLLKQVLKNTFPNITGPMLLSQDELTELKARMLPAGIISLWYGDPEDCPVGWAICDGTQKMRADGTGYLQTPDPSGKALIGVLAGTFELGQTYGSETANITIDPAGAHNHGGETTLAGGHDHSGKTSSHQLTLAQTPKHSHLLFAANGTGSLELSDTATKTGTVVASSNTGGDTEYSLNYRESGTIPDRGRSQEVGSGEGHAHNISEAPAHKHGIDETADHEHNANPINLMQRSIALHLIMKL